MLVSTRICFVVLLCILPAAAAPAAEPAGDGEAKEKAKEPTWFLDDRGVKVNDEGPAPGIGKKIALWPFNRILDFLDIGTFNFGFGFGMHGNLHATRAMQLGAGVSALSKLGFDGRRVGLFNEARAEISALPFSFEYYKRMNAFGTFREIDTKKARDRLYLDIRDYFGFGAAITLAIVGIEAELRPTEAVDFLLGIFGVDFKRDDHPRRIRRPRYNRFYTRQRRVVDRMVFVTSRVTRGRNLRAEAEKGVTVYDRRGTASALFGELGVAMGTGADLRNGRNFQRYPEILEYDVAQDIALRLAKEFNERTNIRVVPPTETAEFEDKKVLKQLEGETIRRLPNYKGLCEAYGADAVCDIRLLEWSLYHGSAMSGLRVRLHVELKIIKMPENIVMADISEIVYDQNKRGNSLMQFAKDDGHLVVVETEQAVNRLVSVLGDRILER